MKQLELPFYDGEQKTEFQAYSAWAKEMNELYINRFTFKVRRRKNAAGQYSFFLDVNCADRYSPNAWVMEPVVRKKWKQAYITSGGPSGFTMRLNGTLNSV